MPRCEGRPNVLLRRNLKRHYDRYHTGDAPPPDKFCKLITVDPSVEPSGDEPAQSTHPPVEQHGSAYRIVRLPSGTVLPMLLLRRRRCPPVAAANNKVVLSILELYRDYACLTRQKLDKNFPEIPAEFRPDFINVATSAARYVAAIEEILRTFVNTGCPTDTE